MIILTKPTMHHVVTEDRETMTVTLQHKGRVFSAKVLRYCYSSLCSLTLFRDAVQVQKVPRIENSFSETVQIAKIALLGLAEKAA